MYRSQQLALKYLTAAIALFGVMTIAGLMSAYYYINPDFLFGVLHFNIAKILHIDTMIIWLLMGFMGAIYWFLPDEFGRELVGIQAAEILFYVFCGAVAVVAIVFIVVQYGNSNETGLWLINQGRKYVEAPRWAAIGAIAILAWTPLQVGWKGLIVASSAAFLAIPPITWRFLQRTHETEAQG